MKNDYSSYFRSTIEQRHAVKLSPFDLHEFMMELARPKPPKLLDTYCDIVIDSLRTMRDDNAGLANQFVEDYLPQLGLNFGWQLISSLGLDPGVEALASQLGALVESRVDNDKMALPMPQRMFNSSIYLKQLKRAGTPELNPLMLRILLNVDSDRGLMAIQDYLLKCPLTELQVTLVSMTKGYVPEMAGLLCMLENSSLQGNFIEGLADLESVGMADGAEILRQVTEDESIARGYHHIVRGFYDPDYAALHASEITRNASDLIGNGVVEVSLMSFVKHSLARTFEAGLDGAKGKLLKNLLSDDEQVSQISRPFYGLLLDAFLDVKSLVSTDLEQVLQTLANGVKRTGPLRDRANQISSSLFVTANGTNNYRGRELAGRSPGIRALIEDLACHAAVQKVNPVVKGKELGHLVEDGIVTFDRLVAMTRSEAGRKVCAQANLPSDIVKRLPKRFIEHQFSSDLGL